MSSNTESIVDAGDRRIAESSLAASDAIGQKGENILPSTLWDRLGIAGSLLCVMHCALTPLLIGYLSAVGLGVVGDEIVHKILAVLLLCVAVLAFAPGYKRHANVAVLTAGVAGVGLIVAGGLLLAPFIGHGLEIGLTVIGSLLLIGAHAVNWRLSDCSESCTAH